MEFNWDILGRRVNYVSFSGTSQSKQSLTRERKNIQNKIHCCEYSTHLRTHWNFWYMKIIGREAFRSSQALRMMNHCKEREPLMTTTHSFWDWREVGRLSMISFLIMFLVCVNWYVIIPILQNHQNWIKWGLTFSFSCEVVRYYHPSAKVRASLSEEFAFPFLCKLIWYYPNFKNKI